MSTPIVTQMEELILASYESMYRLAYSYVKHEEDAMDIVQESAYKAIKCASNIRQPKHLKTWLWRIVINTSIDYIRKRQMEISCDPPAETAAWDHYPDFDTIDALSILDEREQAVIILRFFEDRKIQEIAGILEQNPNTIKSILYRSLKKLKARLLEGELLYERGTF